ncbi:hypothetical protein RFI_32572, partial [Reticulomyxa filosa]
VEQFLAIEKESFNWVAIASAMNRLQNKNGTKSERDVIAAVLEAVVRHILKCGREKRKDESDKAFFHREFAMWDLIQNYQMLLFNMIQNKETIADLWHNVMVKEVLNSSSQNQPNLAYLLTSFHLTCSKK